MLLHNTTLEELPGHIQTERAQVECSWLLELRRRSWESEETKEAVVHSMEYQKEKTYTEVNADIYRVPLLSIQLSSDHCTHVGKLPKARKKSPNWLAMPVPNEHLGERTVPVLIWQTGNFNIYIALSTILRRVFPP